MAQRSFSNASCTASAMDRGATITSWHPHDAHEALFVTQVANPDAEFHGGIPVCAPWFGWGRAQVEVPHKHGLVRWVDWRFEGAKQLPDATRATWTLTQADVAHLPGAEAYPPDLTYRLVATFGRELHVELTIGSPTSAVVVDEAFHPYLLVNAVDVAEITGVTHAPLRISGEYDEVHAGAGANVVRVTLPDRWLEVEATGASDLVVWNPGRDYAQGLDDFEGSDWRRMLCVEPGNVRDGAVTIPAGGEHMMAMTVRIGSRTA